MTDAFAGMEEGQRQAYLAALGIPLWSSRHDLPGAQASAGLAFVPFLMDAGDAALPVTEVSPATAPRIENPRVGAADAVPVEDPLSPENQPARHSRESGTKAPQGVEQPQAGPKGSEAHSLPDKAVAHGQRDSRLRWNDGHVLEAVRAGGELVESKNTSDHPRFACRVQLLAPGLLGVIALDDVPDLSAQEYRLLENLMLAVSGDMATDSAREHFRWPLSPNPAIPRDAGAAREALAAFLGRRREATRWLVLGETLAVYVRTALPQHTVIAAPLLRELLENPAAKRQLWQALHG